MMGLARAAHTAMVVAALATLVGCTGAPTAQIPGDYPDLTLGETAAPTAVLRDQAAGRLPASAVSEQLAPVGVSDDDA